MEIILDHEQKPQGVFLPLAEWKYRRTSWIKMP